MKTVLLLLNYREANDSEYHHCDVIEELDSVRDQLGYLEAAMSEATLPLPETNDSYDHISKSKWKE